MQSENSSNGTVQNRLAFNKTVVTRYRISLEQQPYASMTINLRVAAVRSLAYDYEAADCGLLSADLAAGIRRVKGAKRLGLPVGNWLTAEQGRRLLRTVDCSSLRGKRDHAALALLLGCGLRRAELTTCELRTFSRERITGLSPTLLAKVDTFAPFQCRSGLKQELMPGGEPPASRAAFFFVRSTRPAESGEPASVLRSFGCSEAEVEGL
jgi:hypothetical protein